MPRLFKTMTQGGFTLTIDLAKVIAVSECEDPKFGLSVLWLGPRPDDHFFSRDDASLVVEKWEEYLCSTEEDKK